MGIVFYVLETERCFLETPVGSCRKLTRNMERILRTWHIFIHAKTSSRQDSTAVSTAVQTIRLSWKSMTIIINLNKKNIRCRFYLKTLTCIKANHAMIMKLTEMELAGNTPIFLQMQNSKNQNGKVLNVPINTAFNELPFLCYWGIKSHRNHFTMQLFCLKIGRHFLQISLSFLVIFLKCI